MARNITVQVIVDVVQILLEDPNHKVATEAEYIRRIDRANSRLYACYVAAEPDRYRTEATITGVSNTSAYALPAAWLATIAVDFRSGPSYEQLYRLQEEERNDFIGQNGQSRAYRVIGTNVVLYPTPLTGQTYTHVYIPTATPLTSVSDVIDCRLGHEDYLEKCVARDLLNAKREYDGRWDADIEKLEAELKMEANYRYFADMARMTIRGSRRSWPYGFNGQRWPWYA